MMTLNATTNPREIDIETNWSDLREMLSSGDAHGAKQKMDDLFENDFPIWNAMYWRMDSWFASYFGRAAMTAEEEKLGFSRLEVGAGRFRIWLDKLNPGCEVWTICGLPKIIGQMKADRNG